MVTFSARVAGDPVAGVQEVWATWTGRADNNGVGHWQSVPLTQNPDDSTLWTGTLTLDGNQPSNDVRFIVQAANGVGAVGVNAAEGDGYRVTQGTEAISVDIETSTPSATSPLGVRARVIDNGGRPVQGRTVRFTVQQGGSTLYEYAQVTGADGTLVLPVPSGVTAPTGLFTVVASIFGTDGAVVATDTEVDVDTARVTLQTATPSPPASPLGVTALVKDASGTPWANRRVRWTVSRGGADLYSYIGFTGADGKVSVTGNGGGTPAGALTVKAEVLALAGTVVRDTASTTVTLGGFTITPTPTALAGRAGLGLGSLTATVTDGRGTVKGVDVTFTLPAGAPGATFASGPNTLSPTQARVTTNASGVAVSPVMTAKTTVGSFFLRLSTDGAPNVDVPVAAQYGFAAFVSPVGASTTTSPTGTTPVKIAALLAGGAKISDAEGLAIAAQQRFQVRWRLAVNPPPTNPWIDQRNTVTSYDTAKDFFQTDLKASSLGWEQGKTYVVQVRILPVAGSAQPSPAQSLLQGSFDLGTAQFTITVNKK